MMCDWPSCSGQLSPSVAEVGAHCVKLILPLGSSSQFRRLGILPLHFSRFSAYPPFVCRRCCSDRLLHLRTVRLRTWCDDFSGRRCSLRGDVCFGHFFVCAHIDASYRSTTTVHNPDDCASYIRQQRRDPKQQRPCTSHNVHDTQHLRHILFKTFAVSI